MFEPAVRYVTTRDGVRVAYTVTGEGPPHVFVTEPVVSHVALEWSQPIFKRIYETLARHNTLIRFDIRGSGLSDRGALAVQPAPFEDLRSVVEAAGLDTFALTVVQSNTINVMEYVAAHPGRVTHLAVVDGFLRSAEARNTPQIIALTSAATADFVLATEVIGAMAFGPSREESRDYGGYIRSCISPDYFPRLAALPDRDGMDFARSISVPTLVIRHDAVQFVTLEMSREVAATIPGAQFAVVPGGWADDPTGLAERIAAFINDERPGAVRPAASARPGATTKPTLDASDTAVILFTDIANSTALTERIGDAAFRANSRALDSAMRAAIREAGGTPVDGKLLGDGVMAVFSSAARAIDAARRCIALSAESELPLHVGLHAGDVIREQTNVYGGAVNIASRICGLSAPGEILVSRTIRDLARTSAGVGFEDRGEHELKGIDDALRVYAVRVDVE